MERSMKSLVKVRNDGGKAISASKLEVGDYFLGRSGELRMVLAAGSAYADPRYVLLSTGYQGNQPRGEQVQRVDVTIKTFPRDGAGQ
jgi:hypothetical protein